MKEFMVTITVLLICLLASMFVLVHGYNDELKQLENRIEVIEKDYKNCN